MTCLPTVFTCERLLSAHTHNKLYGELVEAFIAVAALRYGLYVEGGLFQLLHRIGAVAAAQQLLVGGVAAVDLLEQLLDFGVLLEVLHFGFEHIVGAHAAEGEVPDALLIFGAVGMGIEVVRAVIVLLFQQFDEEEHALDVLCPKADVLVKARAALIVQVDVEELARVERLCDGVDEIETGHVFVRHLWIDTNHLWMVQRVDEGEHVADGWQVDIGARLIWLRLQSEAQVVAVVNYILAQEVHGVAHALEGHNRVFRRLRVNAFAPAPEDVNAGSQLRAQIDCLHGLLQSVGAYCGVIRGESSIFEDRVEEEIGSGHRHDHAVVVQSLFEVAHDAVALGRRGVYGTEVVVVQADAPCSQF